MRCCISLLLSLTGSVVAQDWIFHEIDADRGPREARGADGVRLGDIDGDGFIDVVSGWEQAGETRLYFNPGPSAVREPWPMTVVGPAPNAEDAVFVDLDGNGILDVVSACENKGKQGGGGLHIHWAPERERLHEAAAWQSALLPASAGQGSWMYTLPMQVDGRHGMDLIAGGKGTPLVWYQAPVDARQLENWQQHVISETTCGGGWTMALVAADMDGDGDQDVFWTTRKAGCGGVRWLENPGPGGALTKPWLEHQISSESLDFMFGDVADIDGDGRLDCAAATKEDGILLYRHPASPDATWSVYHLPIPHALRKVKGVAFGDLDGDGRLDLAMTSGVGRPQHWLRWTGESPWSESEWSLQQINPAGGKMDTPVLADLDQDGDLDLLSTMEGQYNVFWYENPSEK